MGYNRRGGCLLPNTRVIVLHQGEQRRSSRGMKGWLIRAQKPRSKRISCKGQLLHQDVDTNTLSFVLMLTTAIQCRLRVNPVTPTYLYLYVYTYMHIHIYTDTHIYR